MKRQAILFLIDTQGANCVGCYTGNNSLRTPNLDRFAAAGARFNRAYTCSPVCGPARSAIFTGLYPHSNGVFGNDMAPHLDIPTLGQRLSDAGIHAGYIGKWHLDGTDYFGDGRCPSGWDSRFWFDGRNYLESLPDDHARDVSRRFLGPEEIAEHGITAEFTHAHRIADRARDFIARNKDEDFLLVVSIDEPHGPCIAPEPFVGAFDDFLFPVPNADTPLEGKPRGQRDWAEYVQANVARSLVKKEGKTWFKNPRHFACNSFSDHEVGRVLSAIDAHTPDALVIYTSDHGDMFGSHGLLGKGPAMYEEITRIPWLVRWPGNTAAGAVSDALVSHIDIVPTMLDFFGLPIPPLLQGKSLLAPFQDAQAAANDVVFIEFNRFEVDHDGFGGFAPIRCVFDGRHKLAINLLDTDELYDLETDSFETRNLIDDPSCGEIRDRLHRRLLDWMNATRDPLRGPHWNRRAWGGIAASTWGGPTRPRPFDEAYYPRTLLYETGKEIERFVYEKR